MLRPPQTPSFKKHCLKGTEHEANHYANLHTALSLHPQIIHKGLPKSHMRHWMSRPVRQQNDTQGHKWIQRKRPDIWGNTRLYANEAPFVVTVNYNSPIITLLAAATCLGFLSGLKMGGSGKSNTACVCVCVQELTPEVAAAVSTPRACCSDTFRKMLSKYLKIGHDRSSSVIFNS